MERHACSSRTAPMEDRNEARKKKRKRERVKTNRTRDQSMRQRRTGRHVSALRRADAVQCTRKVATGRVGVTLAGVSNSKSTLASVARSKTAGGGQQSLKVPTERSASTAASARLWPSTALFTKSRSPSPPPSPRLGLNIRNWSLKSSHLVKYRGKDGRSISMG